MEVLEGPIRKEAETRIRAQAKDGTVGWLTTRAAEGKQILECCG